MAVRSDGAGNIPDGACAGGRQHGGIQSRPEAPAMSARMMYPDGGKSASLKSGIRFSGMKRDKYKLSASPKSGIRFSGMKRDKTKG
jgi:hypothetical protein